MPFERAFVEYAQEEACLRPVAFTSKGRRREVTEIVDRWYEGGVEPGRPRIDYFKVMTAEGDKLFLRYVSLFDAWSIWIEEDEDLTCKTVKN